MICLATALLAANAPDKTNKDAKPEKTTTAPVTNAAPAEFVVPKSVFIDDPSVGRDPFFPESRRRKPVVAETPKNTKGPTTAQTPAQPVVKKDPFAGLVLQGLTGPRSRRLVTINGTGFAQGETAFVKTTNGPVRLTVVEIRGTSAVVAVEGQTERRELKLPGEL